MPVKIVNLGKRLFSPLIYVKRFQVGYAYLDREIDDSGFLSILHSEYSEHVASLYEACHGPVHYLQKVVRNRFESGFRLFEILHEGELAAVLWINAHGNRFVDELALDIKFPDKSLITRDIYVFPNYRGRRLLKTIIDVVAKQYFPEMERVYCMWDLSNLSAQRAYEAAGFNVVISPWTVTIMKRWMVRSCARKFGQAGKFRVRGYQTSKRILRLDDSYSRYIGDNLI